MTTATTQSEVTYLEAISQALDEEMTRDERVFLMGEDIGVPARGKPPLASDHVGYATGRVRSLE